MTKTLAIATLALGLFAFGCDDDEDGGTTNKPDASDASTPSSPDAKADTTTNTDTPVTADAGADTASTPDTGTDDGGGTDGLTADWTTCTDPKDNVSAAEFCAKYFSACTFDPTGGTTGMERYKNLEDCVSGYRALSATKQGCVAYHLCVASTGGTNTATHCPHPPQASLGTPGNPCAAR
jgi:hypothetical protein